MTVRLRPAMMMVALLAACGRSKKPSANQSSSASTRTDTFTSNRQFPGILMFPEVRAYLDSIAKDSVEVMKRQMAPHTARIFALVDAVGIDMTNLNMDPPENWIALLDSINTDLDDLPKFAVDSLKKKMTSHVSRVKRFMNIHQEVLEVMGGY